MNPDQTSSRRSRSGRGFACALVGVLALAGCEAKPAAKVGAKVEEKKAEVEVISVNQDTFQEQVLNSKLPVVIDFWAPWCKPCLMMAPMVEELASDFDGKVRFVKVDIDENPLLHAKYVRGEGIPMLMVFKKGQPVGVSVGFSPDVKPGITKFLNSLDQLPELSEEESKPDASETTPAEPGTKKTDSDENATEPETKSTTDSSEK